MTTTLLAGLLLGTNAFAFAGKFEILAYNYSSKDSVLYWKASGDTTKVFYIFQQYRWKKWVNWDTIPGFNAKDTSTYSLNIGKYIHGGYNTFRVKAIHNKKVMGSFSFNQWGKERPSIHLSSFDIPRLRTEPIDFGYPTCYEVYDQYGRLIKRGCDQTLWVNELGTGIYFLSYDNKPAIDLMVSNK